MKGRPLVALSVALALLLPVGIAVPTVDPLDPLPTAAQEGAISGKDTPFDRAMERLSAKLPASKLHLELADENVIPGYLQTVIDGTYPHTTFVVGAGTTLNLGPGPVVINDHWEVSGTVNFVDAEIIFDGPWVVDIKGPGTVTVTGASSIHDMDSNPFTFGSFRATGNLTIEGTAAQKIPIQSTSIVLLARGNNDFATAKVRHTVISGVPTGVSIQNSAAVVELNAFYNNDRGIVVLAPGGLAGAGNPTVNDNRFTGNQVGVSFAAATRGGTVTKSEFQANGIGVRCASGAGTAGSTPRALQNNFRNQYLEAYAGFRGIAGVSADSVCVADGNHFASGESTFASGQDAITNNAASPIANAAPASPVPVTVVTSTQTLTNPVLSGPLISDNGGALTINGVMNANGYLWGSGTGGRVATTNLQVVNNGQLLLRSDTDTANGVKFDGPAQRGIWFATIKPIEASSMHALQWRSNAPLSNWVATNAHAVLTQTAASHADDGQFISTINGFSIDGAVQGMFRNLYKTTNTGSTFKNIELEAVRAQLGTETFNNNVVQNVGLGHPTYAVPVASGATAAYAITGVLQPVTAAGNNFNKVMAAIIASGAITADNNVVDEASLYGIGVALAGATTSGNKISRAETGGFTAQQGSLTSTNDAVDGNFVGYFGILGQTSISGATITQNTFGVLSAVDTTFSVSGSTFAYNAYGAFAWADSVTISSSNFRDNYLQSLLTVPGDPLFAGALTPAAITCTNCFFYRADDRAWNTNPGGTITVSESLSPNAAPSPPWLASVVIADGGDANPANDVVALSPGAMSAPAIARAGGRIVIDGITIDGQGKWVFGAKTGGNAQGPTGRMTLSNSVVDNMRFIAVNSTSSIISDNVFNNAGELIEMAGNGMTVECNQFNGVSLPVNWMRQKAGAPPLVFQRNLLTGSGGVDAGFSDTDVQETHIVNNGYVSGSGGLFDRFSPGHTEFHGNNLISADGLREFSKDGYGFTAPPDAMQAQNNYWNAAGGPTVVEVDQAVSGSPLKATLFNGGGARIVLPWGTSYPTATPPQPVYTPFDAAGNVITPCVNFVYAPLKPLRVEDTVSFQANAFAPSGGSITSYTWSWGDGTPNDVTASPSITHVFPSFGVKTVTLTVSTSGGATNFISKPVKVFARPVASFSSSPAAPLETQTVTLTDTSTDPDGAGIASRAWSCSDGFAASGASASHKFADGGSYSCSLTVVDGDGFGSAPVAQAISVAHVGPVANFATAPAGGLSVQFTDTSTHPNAPVDAPPAGWTYNYDFGDSTSSTDRNPLHAFPAQGVYNIVFTACDNDGLCSAKNLALNLANELPTAHIVATPPSGVVGTSFQLDGSGSSDPDGSIVAWEWDLDNDGATDATGPTASVSFAAQGDYPVSLRVTDDQGGSASATLVLHVCEPPGTIGLSPLSIELCMAIPPDL